jgi:hypothetical protein
MESVHQDAAERIQKNVEDAARLVYLPDGVVELRAFGNERGFQKIYTGWFSDPEKFTAAASELERRECEVYATLNPTPKDLLARANNKLIAANAKVTPQTGNNDIERRRWILIDCDPKRVSKISATEAEKSAALARARLIRADLEKRGMRSILADSGNGAHVLVPVDLPNDADAAKLVENFLKALDFKYSDAAVGVDTTTANAARISKVYGTTARKGESVEEIGRVHRPSAILEVPEDLEPVGVDLLRAVADMCPQEPERTNKPRVGEWDLERWIADHEVPIKKSGPWKDGGQKWILESCPWNGHEDDACYIVQQPTGEIAAGCQHNSCEGHGWRDLRTHFEPDAYERKSDGRRADTAEDAPAGSSGGAKREGNQAQRLIGYAMADAGELFLDQNGTEHALIAGVPVPLDRGCYGWLRRLFWEHEEAAATTDLLATVAGQLRAFAEVSGNEHHLCLRAAQHEGALYHYLGPGRVVRVDAYGWRMDPDPPVMFRRVANLKELPDPERGGSLELLDAFITAQEDRDHRLAKAWLALALLADVNRPILLAHGPQGATKSSVQRVLKNIIDPARPTTLKLREKDFEQNINKAFIPFFDNVSTITDYMADELSKAVTGAGNAVRKLYEDDEDIIREYKRAMLLNGLVIPTEKADLIDRILPVALKRVPKEERETERRMQALFEERHPKLLGAVLDALSGALAYHEEVRGLPRLADWAEYAIALYKHLDWGGYDGFMQDWAVVEEGQHATTLESSALAQCVISLMQEHTEVIKTPAEMLKLLKDAAFSEGIDPDMKGNDFPASASWLWKRLVPVIPTLEAFRISVTDGQHGSGTNKKRFIRIAGFGTPDGDSSGTARDSKEKMLAAEKADTYAPGTAGTAGTAFFPRNSKYTERRIDTSGVLQGGIFTDPADRAVPEAYLSQTPADSKEDATVPSGGSAVPEPGYTRVTGENLDEYLRELEDEPYRINPGGRYESFSPAVQEYYWRQRDAGYKHYEALSRAAAYEAETEGG